MKKKNNEEKKLTYSWKAAKEIMGTTKLLQIVVKIQ